MDTGESWWEAIKATVTRLGEPGSRQRVRALFFPPEPSSLDLHGMTVQAAHSAVMTFIATTPHRHVVIITGRSGQIRQEFPYWVEHHPRVRSADELNGGGAFRVALF